MAKRIASCRCGQLTAQCAGLPKRVSVCHCLECQKRTGSSFGVQARFPDKNVQIKGKSTTWERTGETGNIARYHFCPECGSTVYYKAGPFPDMIAIPVGAFADPTFLAPSVSIYEIRKHEWVTISGENIEHHD